MIGVYTALVRFRFDPSNVQDVRSKEKLLSRAIFATSETRLERFIFLFKQPDGLAKRRRNTAVLHMCARFRMDRHWLDFTLSGKKKKHCGFLVKVGHLSCRHVGFPFARFLRPDRFGRQTQVRCHAYKRGWLACVGNGVE